MNKLELKHLAPYFPYGLKVKITMEGCNYMLSTSTNIAELEGIYGDDMCLLKQNEGSFDLDFNEFKPILRPLSDLNEEIEVDGEKIDITDYVSKSEILQILDESKLCRIHYVPYGIIGRLFEWHFDVFGLIPKGLAIDINTL